VSEKLAQDLFSRRDGEKTVLKLKLNLVPILLLAGTSALGAQEAAQTFFETNCAACHTIGGGRLVGPDLHGVSQRQTRDWLVKFMIDPPAMLESGDSYAQELLAASNNVPMPKLPGVDTKMANALLDYIASKSGTILEPAPVEEEVPFTAEEMNRGEGLFIGSASFENGAPACISCHNVAEVGGFFGGGQLGPDLTTVYSRLGESRGLSAWLSSPASETMKPIFKDAKMTDSEIRSLVAFFSVNGQDGVEPATQRASFFYTGVAAAAAILLLFGFLWRGRFRATRIPMVEASKR
jgi:mono/diheme cytochrome c family protein